MPELVIRPPQGPERKITLGKLRVTVGRSPRADVMLEDPFASRVHAELRFEGEQCWVQDLGSANGTRLNEAVLDDQPALIGPGDLVRIGATRIEVLADRTGDTGRSAAAATSLLKLVQKSGPPDEPAGLATQQGLATVLATVRRATAPESGSLERAPALDVAPASTLEVISKIGLALLSTASLDEVLQQILDHVLERIAAERAFLLLRDPDGGEPEIKAAAWADRRTGALPEKLDISSFIRDEVIERGRSVLTSDAQLDERFKGRESVVLSGVRSVMAVPLASADAILGMVYADSPLRVKLFDDDDLRLLTTIASVAAIKVQNALLMEERIETERMRQQLQSARNIQSRLLPGRPPAVPGYDMTGISFSCFEVGGDYFDFIPIDDTRMMLALGDVSGKGLDAAILMSSLHASIRAQAESGASVVELGNRVNRYLVRNTPANKFATLFCAILDHSRHELRYMNAGHNPPLIVRADGTMQELAATAPPVGMLESVTQTEGRASLGPGDVLLVYSDGLSEAMNVGGEEFGPERIAEVLVRHRGLQTARVRDRLDEALLAFMGESSPADDLTLLLVRRDG